MRGATASRLWALALALAAAALAVAATAAGDAAPPRSLHPQAASSLSQLGRLGSLAAALAEQSSSAEQSSPAGGSASASVSASGPAADEAGVLSVSLSRNGGVNRKAVAKARAGNEAYQRLLSVSAHAAQLQAAQRRRAHLQAATPGTSPPIPLTGCPFADFTIPVRMGSQSFELLVDTGSSTLAVAGGACTNCGGVSPLWEPTPGVSFNQRQTARGSYGDLSGWSGAIWLDEVALAGRDGRLATMAASQRIVVMTSQSTEGRDSAGRPQAGAGPFFIDSPCSEYQEAGREQITTQGIIGMAYPRLAMAGTDSFVFKLFEAQPSLRKEFSIQMCESSGNLWVGGSDPASYYGDFQYTPLTRELYYDVAPAQVFIGGERLNVMLSDWTPSTQSILIVDSGTTLWELPNTIYRRIVESLLAHPSFQVHFRADPNDNFFDHGNGYCETPNSGASWQTLQEELPTITIEMQNGLQLTMDGVGSYLLPCTPEYDQWTPGIVGGDTGMIAGWPFMNQFVVMHNISARTLGFAVQKSCTTSKPTLRANVTFGELHPGASNGDSASGRNAGAALIESGSFALSVPSNILLTPNASLDAESELFSLKPLSTLSWDEPVLLSLSVSGGSARVEPPSVLFAPNDTSEQVFRVVSSYASQPTILQLSFASNSSALQAPNSTLLLATPLNRLLLEADFTGGKDGAAGAVSQALDLRVRSEHPLVQPTMLRLACTPEGAVSTDHTRDSLPLYTLGVAVDTQLRLSLLQAGDVQCNLLVSGRGAWLFESPPTLAFRINNATGCNAPTCGALANAAPPSTLLYLAAILLALLFCRQ